MKIRHIAALVLIFMSLAPDLSAQADRHDVRSGNRQFRKQNWKEADICYRKAVVKDSTSIPANYNLANVLYRQENYEEAAKVMDRIKDNAGATSYAPDVQYNAGDIAIAKKDWQGAVNAFREALLRNPGDMDAKENYIYARKMLDNQQKGGGGGQDKNDGNDQQNQNQNGDGDGNQNKDQNQNQQDRQNQQGQNGAGRQDEGGQSAPQPVKISPQQAQQMLRAIQSKEKETQDKVNKEKAEALKSRQKEKNW